MTTDLITAVENAVRRRPDPAPALRRLAGDHSAIAVLRLLAGLQDGQFAVAQAMALGLGREAIRWLRTSGETELVRPGIARFGSAVGEPNAAVTAYLLCWPSAVVSHRDAARFHRLSSPQLLPDTDRTSHVTIEHGSWRSPTGVTVHVTRRPLSKDIIWDGAVAYTTTARTVCDIADVAKPWATLTLVDDAIAGGASRAWLHSRATALACGRGGVCLVRDVTAKGSVEIFRSWLERTAASVYRQAHLPDPEWNVKVHDEQGCIGIVDALWPQWRVISEKEGLRFHTTPRQRKRDAERFNRLLDAGYAARRFTWFDVVERPIYVATTLARPLIAAGAPVDLTRIPRAIVLPDPPFVR